MGGYGNIYKYSRVILLSVILTTVAGKKCSKTLNRIPAHKNFEIDKFVGEWFQVSRTEWFYGDKTFESSNIEVLKREDGSYHLRQTGQLGDRCMPVQDYEMTEHDRPGHFVLSNANYDTVSMVVSFTSYKMALVLYCFQHKYDGTDQCTNQGFHIDILSRSQNPLDKDVTQYVKRGIKRLCGGAKDFIKTKPGVCKIPEILKAAKMEHEDVGSTDALAMSADKCAVENIPTQSDFDLSKMEGLWYEIARTRFTFNKMESVVSHHRYDDVNQNIFSHYTGTLVNGNAVSDEQSEPTCMTAIKGMSKSQTTEDGVVNTADRLGRIGWDDSIYPWSTLKVVYADGDYTLFYACYHDKTNVPCPQQAMEVTLVGKSREISSEKREEIYSILPQMCVDPSDMKETEFLANCSSWVAVKANEISPESCKLNDIPIYMDYSNDELNGLWYQYASISYDNVTALRGVIRESYLEGMSETVQHRYQAFLNEPGSENECMEYSAMSRHMCIDTADHIVTFPVGNTNKFVFSKVLYLDEQLLIEYMCTKRTEDGHCEKSGVQFTVYTKNDTLVDSVQLEEEAAELIQRLAKTVCLDPEDLQIETSWCSYREETKKDDDDVDFRCDVDQITIFSDMDDFDQQQMYGYWYEIAHSAQRQYIDDVISAVAYFTSGNNETLSIYYSGITKESEDDSSNKDEGEYAAPECSPVNHKHMVARCALEPAGDYMAFDEGNGNYNAYIPFKIIYTDYTGVLVTFACLELLHNGHCSSDGVHIRIWARNSTLDEEAYNLAKDMVYWACADPYKEGFIAKVAPNDDSCTSGLEDYVTENELDISDVIMPTDDVTSDNKNEPEHSDHQMDERRDYESFDISDLSDVFLISDDEFYADDNADDNGDDDDAATTADDDNDDDE